MSKNDRGGLPGFADPAYDLLDTAVKMRDVGVEWAEAVEAFLSLPLATAQALVADPFKRQQAENGMEHFLCSG